uniref:Uncharacterized protein n=1 Tax=Arundo donax TaxID=35708 RepID=A0A0A9EB01_ARUDO
MYILEQVGMLIALSRMSLHVFLHTNLLLQCLHGRNRCEHFLKSTICIINSLISLINSLQKRNTLIQINTLVTVSSAKTSFPDYILLHRSH